MNHTALLSMAVGIACWASLDAAAQGTTAAGRPPSTAASAPAATAPRAAKNPQQKPERQIESNAASSAQRATTPGDLRPENPVMPQLSVQLPQRGTPANDRPGAATTGTIDDSAARCRAAANQRDREACMRGGGVPISPPSASSIPKR